MLKIIAKTFDLSVVRARSGVRAAMFHFAFVASVTAVKSATNALYLARRDVHDLPWLYLATALVVTAVTVSLGKRLASVSARPILRQGLLVAAVVLVVLSTLAALDVRASLGLLYVASEAYATALSTLFWARLGEVFDIRAAKRIFGPIGAAGMAGATLGGLLVKALAHDVPSVTWCFVAALTMILLRPLLGRGDRPPGTIRERVSFGEGLRYAAMSDFSRRVAFLVLLLSVETAAIDYVFRTGSHHLAAGDEASMAALFGILNAAVGVLAIFFQTALTPILLRRLGVFAYMAIIPAGCVLAGVWAAFTPGSFAPIFTLKLLEMMGSFSLYQPGLQLLYNPMPGAVRGSVRAVIDGAVRKLGGALGGLVLLAGGSLLDPEVQLAMVIALGGSLVVWIRLLRPTYVKALESKLGARDQATIPAIDPSDRTTREQLLRAVSQVEDPGRTLSAISVLEQEKDFDPREYIPILIAHPAEAVRQKAIDLIERAPDASYAAFLISLIEADTRLPKAQAARALMLVDPDRAREVLSPILTGAEQATDQGLLAAVIVAFLAGGSVTGDLSAERAATADLANLALLSMLERGAKAQPSERREVARLLGFLGPGPYAHRLAEYLEDPISAVRKAAIEAAGKARDEALPPILVKRLADRSVLRAVHLSLCAYGDAVVPLLAQALDDRRVDLLVRVQIPRILRKIGTPAAANAMLYSNIQDDAYLRYVIVEALGRMRRDAPGLAFDRARAFAAVMRRLRAYTHYRPISADLATGGEPFKLLHRAAHDRVRQNLEAGVRLLGLPFEIKTMENALIGLQRGDRASRADALEIIDVALAGSEVREQVLLHLEPGPAVGIAGRAKERALGLVEGRDIQLAMIAQETLRRTGENPPEVREPTSGEPLMPRSILERLFLLQDVQLFRGLSVDDLAAVAAITSDGHAEPQEVVYEEGVPGDSMYVIIAGEIHLLHGGSNLLDLHVGESFGQTSILDGGPRPVSARAGDEGADFVRIERQAFLDLMTDRPELMNGLLIELGERIRELIALSEKSPNRKEETLRGSESQIPARESSRPYEKAR